MGKQKYIVFALLFMVFAFLLNRCAFDDTKEKKPITIGVDAFHGWAHIFIAQEKGYFEKNGVDVKIVFNQDYLKVKEQYEYEEVDGAFLVYTDSIFLNSRGVDSYVVYISDFSITADVLVVHPGIKTFDDLKGKPIGIEGNNSFSHVFISEVLRKNGIKGHEIYFKSIDAQDIINELEQGEIVAGHTYGPGKTKALAKGYHPMACAGDVRGMITDVLVFPSALIESRPKEIKAIVKSLFEAKQFQELNRDEALMIMAQAIGDTPLSVGAGIDAVKHLDEKENLDVMTEEIKEEGYESYSLIESGDKIATFFLERGQLSSIPDFEETIHKDFVKELVEESLRSQK